MCMTNIDESHPHSSAHQLLSAHGAPPRSEGGSAGSRSGQPTFGSQRPRSPDPRPVRCNRQITQPASGTSGTAQGAWCSTSCPWEREMRVRLPIRGQEASRPVSGRTPRKEGTWTRGPRALLVDSPPRCGAEVGRRQSEALRTAEVTTPVSFRHSRCTTRLARPAQTDEGAAPFNTIVDAQSRTQPASSALFREEGTRHSVEPSRVEQPRHRSRTRPLELVPAAPIRGGSAGPRGYAVLGQRDEVEGRVQWPRRW